MSKIRVYELAKELGLENKAVLDLCVQLGFEDKSSHSNSLSDDEADRIRRSVIRRAVNERGGSVREVSKEGHRLTESRVGNVIRRRKKSDEEAAAEAGPRIDIDLASAPMPDLPTLAPDPDSERASRAAALREADALFSRKPAAELAPDDEEASPIETAIAEQDEGSSVQEGASMELSEELSSSSEPLLHAEDAVLETSDEEESEGVSGDEAEAERLADVRKRLDIRAPKILGKIELPTKPAPVKRGATAAPGRSTPASDTEDTSSRAKPKKRGKTVVIEDDLDELSSKRPKKKQILRKDELLDYDGERDGWRTKKDKKRKGADKSGQQADVGPTKQAKKVVKVAGHISVGELAKQMSVKVGEVLASLMRLGTMATINQLLDYDTATIVTSEFGFSTQNTDQDIEEIIANIKVEDSPEEHVLRPPVVTVMGHVDHGKTSLLDAIRKTSVTKGEAGGITQHIGAYNVSSPSGGSVTFLDTPGHEAFTAMRGRGAKATDIVVLVVAADDGVMPQTIEAINHARAANVPIIVAINKIDKEGANRDRVIAQLGEYGLIPEEWGGDTIMVPVSALTGEGLDLLLENLHLQAEILELKANPTRAAVGTVVESKIDKGRGPVITILVQNGTLRKGDVFASGGVFGRVRALVRDNGEKVDEAGPSIPVEVLGASAAAMAGDDFLVCESEAQARHIAAQRSQIRRLKELASSDGNMMGTALTLEKFSEMVNVSSDMKELPLIVKADVQGSVEALAASLSQLSNEEVKVRVVHRGVGAISENDVQLATASRAILVGFNVRPDARASQLIDQEGLQVLYSRVIYELVENVEAAVKGLRAPVYQEKTLGHVEVRQTFKVPRLGTIAGSYVTDGVVPRGSMIRLLRDGRVVYEGKLSSLRRFKDDVREVAAGYECGIGIEGYSDIKEGDVLEVFKVEEVRV